MSWTADGVFYVNVTDDLVFYNFVTRDVTNISSWTPLFENLMGYNGLPNSEFITQDGSEVYAVGCPSNCEGTPEPNVEIEVANVTTGVVWSYSFVGLTYSTAHGLGETNLNVQALMIGVDGADNEAVVVDEENIMWGVPVGSSASTAPTELANFSFFEANNLDWMPSLNALINEQAGGSITDGWQEWQWNGSALTEVAFGTWGSMIKSQFADAGGFNISAGAWALTAGDCATSQIANGVLTISDGVVRSFRASAGKNNVDTCPYTTPRPPLNTGGNLGVQGGGSDRVPITASGPFVAEGWNNTSAILDPVTGEWYTLGVAANPGIFGPSGTYSTANLFHNGSYLVSPRSGSCEITCSLLGQAGASAASTVWWLWNSVLPEFPYNSTSPVAETSSPAAPIVSVNSSISSTATVSWNESLAAGPLLNFTLCWISSAQSGTHCVALMPWNTSFTIYNLIPDAELTVGVVALNFHYFGATSWVEAKVLGPFEVGVVIVESGLPAGTQWYANLSGGLSLSSSSAFIEHALGNGTYVCAFATSETSFVPYPPRGEFTVSGGIAFENVTFGPATFTVEFSETGLPSGSNWTVTLNSTTHASFGGVVVEFAEPNGSYDYTVNPVSGFQLDDPTGTVTVAGQPLNESVSFFPLVLAYPVEFSAVGLPAETNWSVTIGGTTDSSRTQSIVFLETNGTYDFSIGQVRGYSVKTASSSVEVAGNGQHLIVQFSRVNLWGLTPAGRSSGLIWVFITMTVFAGTVALVALVRANRRRSA